MSRTDTKFYKGQQLQEKWPLALTFFLHRYTLLISVCLQKLMNIHLCIFKILGKIQSVADGYKILQRAATPREMALSPYFFLTYVHIIDISVSAEIDEYPSLHFEDIRKKDRVRIRLIFGVFIM